MDKTKKFEPSFESLRRFECPDWFRDAKFGIWSHWGPQSVPMCGDWYARHMYVQGSPQYLYHLRHYGHPSRFGYKDICALWKAEKFDPEELMKLYRRAGARYFVGQAMHHDHFFNYPSKINRFNSAQIGPKKDICGLWKSAADKNGMPFGLTEHLGATFSWWRVNKGADSYGPLAGVPYDGNDPGYRDFYLENHEHSAAPEAPAPWYTSNVKFRDYWLSAIKEVIDLYTPDLLYSDGSLPFGEHWHNNEFGVSLNEAEYKWGLEAVAHLYNASISKNGKNLAVYNQKSRAEEIYSVGVLDIEKSQLPGINLRPWQTDTCIGNWFYDAKQEFKKPLHIIEMLIDIVSKNGTMLLNILQLPDGSIDGETLFILEELAGWFAVCEKGIHKTRPWKTFGEGESKALIEGFREVKTDWNSSDYRFTSRDNKLYAFMMGAVPDMSAVIKSIGEGEKVKAVTLLGHGDIPFSQPFGVLTVKLPPVLPTKYTNCIEITL